jgi:adenosine/AMP kinase
MSDEEFWTQQYVIVLGLASEFVAAADAMTEAMGGKMPGVDPRDRRAVAEGMRSVIARYGAARNELVSYAKAAAADMEAGAA